MGHNLSGYLYLQKSPYNRTFANMTFFVSIESATTGPSLSGRIKNVWQRDNLGLDFSSIDIRDYDECTTHWNDCNDRAVCRNIEGAFVCTCAEGLADHSLVLAMPPGRICKNETEIIDADDDRALAIEKAKEISEDRMRSDEEYEKKLLGDVSDKLSLISQRTYFLHNQYLDRRRKSKPTRSPNVAAAI